MKPVTIIGGGLAGLSLGIALRRHGVPVTVREAGRYPRHKVCGEFIAGVRPGTLENLGIGDEFGGAQRLVETAWHWRGRPVRRDRLPRPALGISRHALDARLAARFEALGGELRTGDRHPAAAAGATQNGIAPGEVWTTGRRPAPARWIGLKAHALDMPLGADLEVNLGEQGYAGASAVEGGRVNVCGLFRLRPGLKDEGGQLLEAYLRAAGLGSLARRLADAGVDPASRCAVAAVAFDRYHLQPGELGLGDRFSAIPPFTGNGMSMAFESAETAAPALAAYAAGKSSWKSAVAGVNTALERRFRTRLRVAWWLHPWLYQPARQHLLVAASRLRCLPFQALFRWLH